MPGSNLHHGGNYEFSQCAFSQVATSIAGIRQSSSARRSKGDSTHKAMVQQVVGGAWKGDGADAFVDRLQNIATPKLHKMNEAATLFHTNIGKSGETVNRLIESSRFSQDLEESFNFFK